MSLGKGLIDLMIHLFMSNNVLVTVSNAKIHQYLRNIMTSPIWGLLDNDVAYLPETKANKRRGSQICLKVKFLGKYATYEP